MIPKKPKFCFQYATGFWIHCISNHKKQQKWIYKDMLTFKIEFVFPQELLPDLYLHFQSQGFHTSMYASSWFLTLYATSFSLSLSCRIMDLFISEVSVRHLILSVPLLSNHGFIHYWGKFMQPLFLSLSLFFSFLLGLRCIYF